MRRRQEGLTLLEVLLAVVLLVTGVVLTYSSFASARIWFQDTEANPVEHNLARERLEELQEHVHENTWDTGELAPTGGWQADGAYVVGGEIYNRQYQVNTVVGRKYRQVQVQVVQQ